MKRNTIFRITILCGVALTIASFTTLPQQKGKNDKGEKSQDQSEDKGKGQQKSNDSYPQGNKNQGNKENHNNSQKNDDQNDHGKQNKNSDNGQKHDDGKNNSDKMKNMDNDDYTKMKHGNGNSKSMNGKRDVDVDWNVNDFKNRRNPKDQKKVSVCHKPSDGDEKNGVTINISENALKAHIAHGDKMGDCTVDYGDRWSKDYVKSRENVYNTYEQTWERMSYGEALTRLAAEKLLGIRSNLDRSRTTMAAPEIQRREALILDLQNNLNAMNNQLGLTRQKLDSDVNIIIKL